MYVCSECHGEVSVVEYGVSLSTGVPRVPRELSRGGMLR